MSTILHSPEIFKIENRFSSLFERTLKKGLLNIQGPQIKASVKRAFNSAVFRVQLDKLIDDIHLYSISETDKLISKALSASLIRSPSRHYLSAADTNTQDTPLILTEEAVRQSEELAVEISESIIEMLKDEAIYQEHPSKLAGRILDKWNGEKYRAVRFARTITADIATNTSFHRFQQQGIQEMQIYATIDKRTSPYCRMMHGTVFKTDSPEASKYRTPFHSNCRTAILPVTAFSNIDDLMRYENRDFSKLYGQNFKVLDEGLDSDSVKKIFKDIDKFKEKYSIPKFIFDEDIEKRLMKLGVGVEAEAPKPKTLDPNSLKKLGSEWQKGDYHRI